jgi:hypothetical protein
MSRAEMNGELQKPRKFVNRCPGGDRRGRKALAGIMRRIWAMFGGLCLLQAFTGLDDLIQWTCAAPAPRKSRTESILDRSGV